MNLFIVALQRECAGTRRHTHSHVFIRGESFDPDSRHRPDFHGFPPLSRNVSHAREIIEFVMLLVINNTYRESKEL